MSNGIEKRIEAFLARPEMCDIAESDLDELVHDQFSEMAARVNNAGPEEQARILREGGFEPDALDDQDETVHSIFSTRASAVNNGGTADQIKTLFENGMDEGAILDALEIKDPDPGIP